MEVIEPKEPNYGNNRFTNLIRCCFAEFVGDIIFIFIGSMSASLATGAAGAAAAHGITLAVIIAGMGHISGGHFNPAVTIGVLISGNISIIYTVFYIVAQLLGGFVGALLVRAAAGALYDAPGNAANVNGGLTMPSADVQTYPMIGITCEIIFTYFLVSTVLLTAVDTDSNVLAPLAIGTSIAADIVAGGAVSGASMNPARSLGPAIAYSIFGKNGSDHWEIQYIYYVGPILGGCIAAIIYKLILAKDGKRWIL